MTGICFILITTAPKMEHEVYAELDEISEIVEIHPLFGEYDLIAKAEMPTTRDIGMLVVDKIRPISGVLDTKTLTGLKF